MSKCRIMITFLFLAHAGCAGERLYVKVIDDEGRPVPSATVNVDFTSSHVMLGEGSSHHYEAKTDTNGNAVCGNINYADCRSGTWPIGEGKWRHSDIKMSPISSIGNCSSSS